MKTTFITWRWKLYCKSILCCLEFTEWTQRLLKLICMLHRTLNKVNEAQCMHGVCWWKAGMHGWRVKRAWLDARRMRTENRRWNRYCVTMRATTQSLQEISIYYIRSITLFNILRFALLSYLCLLKMTWEACMAHCNGWGERCDTLISLPRMTTRFIWRRDGCKKISSLEPDLIQYISDTFTPYVWLLVRVYWAHGCFVFFLSINYEACLHLFLVFFTKIPTPFFRLYRIISTTRSIFLRYLRHNKHIIRLALKHWTRPKYNVEILYEETRYQVAGQNHVHIIMRTEMKWTWQEENQK